jgi:diguanylate cyclase (GGDEF)-like protein
MTTDTKILAFNFLQTSEDGYAIFSPEDMLIYCNDTYEDLYCFKNQKAIGKTFTELIYNAYEKNQGVKIDGAADTILEWVAIADSKRRKREFRIFEVDMVDGRWMLFSEQVNESGYLFVQTKNITRLKVLEQQLNRHVEELCELASYDSLTNLLNRRGFNKIFSGISSQASAPQEGALIVLDVDDFKVINDTYGHSVGDSVLIQLAKILQSIVRPHDLVGRIGGEEFVVYLIDANIKLSQKIGERLVQTVAQTPINVEDFDIKITVSAGLCWRDNSPPFEELYREADTKLYKSKHSGKNMLSL